MAREPYSRTYPKYEATYAETNMNDRWRGALEDRQYAKIVSKCNCEGFHKSPAEAVECSIRWLTALDEPYVVVPLR